MGRENFANLRHERFKSCHHCLFDRFSRLFTLNSLIDSLLNEDTLQRSCPKLISQMPHFNVQLFSKSLDKMVCMELDLITYSYDFRKSVDNDKRIYTDLLLAVCSSVQKIDHIFRVNVSLPTDFNVRLLCRVVID